jgi:hypothetical protein
MRFLTDPTYFLTDLSGALALTDYADSMAHLTGLNSYIKKAPFPKAFYFSWRWTGYCV